MIRKAHLTFGSGELKSASTVIDCLRSSYYVKKNKTRNNTKEKSFRYKCMFVNGQVIQFFIKHVLMQNFKCNISFYEIYTGHF